MDANAIEQTLLAKAVYVWGTPEKEQNSEWLRRKKKTFSNHLSVKFELATIQDLACCFIWCKKVHARKSLSKVSYCALVRMMMIVMRMIIMMMMTIINEMTFLYHCLKCE